MHLLFRPNQRRDNFEIKHEFESFQLRHFGSFEQGILTMETWTQQKKTELSDNIILNLDFNLPYLKFSWLLEFKLFLIKLLDKYQRNWEKKKSCRSFSCKNFIIDKMTGRVDIVRRIFRDNSKKLKLKSQENFSMFSDKFTKNKKFRSFNFIFLILINVPEYITPSGHLVF